MTFNLHLYVLCMLTFTSAVYILSEWKILQAFGNEVYAAVADFLFYTCEIEMFYKVAHILSTNTVFDIG